MYVYIYKKYKKRDYRRPGLEGYQKKRKEIKWFIPTRGVGKKKKNRVKPDTKEVPENEKERTS